MFTFGDQEDEEEDNEDVDDDDEDSDQDDDHLEAETPAVQSQRPFNYVCNREEKQSLLFRNAQMVISSWPRTKAVCVFKFLPRLCVLPRCSIPPPAMKEWSPWCVRVVPRRFIVL